MVSKFVDQRKPQKQQKKPKNKVVQNMSWGGRWQGMVEENRVGQFKKNSASTTPWPHPKMLKIDFLNLVIRRRVRYLWKSIVQENTTGCAAIGCECLLVCTII